MAITPISNARSRRDAVAAHERPAPEATCGFASGGGPGPEDIGVECVTVCSWRLTGHRLPRQDPFRLLESIEAENDRLEVLQIGLGFECTTSDSLSDALSHIVETTSGLASRRLGLHAVPPVGRDPLDAS